MDITPATRKGEMILRRHLLPADINDVIIEPGAMYFSKLASSKLARLTPLISAPSAPQVVSP